jgi:beta-lactamase regulating signal transducer with metallopeptidase domain
MIPLESIFSAIGHTLWAVSWQAAVLIIFIGVLSLFFRRATATFRYFLWCIVLLRLCIPVKLEVPFLSWSYLQSFISPLLPSFTRGMDIPSMIRALPEIQLNSGGTTDSPQIIEILPLNEPEIIPIILAVVWLLIVACMSILVIRYIMHTYRLLEECPAVERVELVELLKSLCRRMGIKRIVSLRYLTIQSNNGPSVVGIFRPAIYLPPALADTWNICDIEPVLIHELTHIRRHDLLINMVQAVVQVFYFFNPLVWLVNWRIRVLREEACDDQSIEMLDLQSSHYVRSILNFVEIPRTKSSWIFAGIGFSEGNSTIKKRVRRIMKKNYMPGRKLGVLSLALLFTSGAVGIFLSSCKPGIENDLAGDKTNSVFKETGVFEKIRIEPGKAIDSEKKKLIGKYLYNPAEKNTISFSIVKGWGLQLRPPDAMKQEIIGLSQAVTRYTTTKVEVDDHLLLDSQKIYETPFVYLTADAAFELTDNERKVFGDYLRKGGFAVIDNGVPQDEFGKAEASLRQILRDSLGNDAKFTPIPNDHPLYHCYFDFNDGPPSGKIGVNPGKSSRYLEGIWLGDRLAAIYSDFGYGFRWIEPEKSEPQVKFGVNMVVFALLQKNGIMDRKFR